MTTCDRRETPRRQAFSGLPPQRTQMIRLSAIQNRGGDLRSGVSAGWPRLPLRLPRWCEPVRSSGRAGLTDRQGLASGTGPTKHIALKKPLGVFGNTITALSALYLSQSQADAYARFPDDISVAEGLRAWCDRELWPSGRVAGVGAALRETPEE